MTDRPSSTPTPAGRRRTTKLYASLWIVQAALMLAIIAFLPHLVQQDAPRLVAIERIRRSLAAEEAASPFSAGLLLEDVPFQRPSTLFMRATEEWLSPSTAFRFFTLASTALALAGWLWFAGALRPSRRWFVALLLPLVFHRTHFYGFPDYNLGLAAVPWGVGAALRFARPGSTRHTARLTVLLFVLFGSAAICGIAHQIAVVPYGLFVGIVGLSLWRRPVRATLVIAAAMTSGIVGVAAPMLAAGSAVTPRLWPWSWPPSIFVVTTALDATDPSAGPLKGLHLLGLLLIVLGLAGYRAARRTSSNPSPRAARSRFAPRFSFSARSFGGPVVQTLLVASLALLAAYILLPSRMAPVSFISTRLIPFVFVGAAVVIPSRFHHNAAMMVVGVCVLWAAALTLQFRAQRAYAGLDEIADILPAGTWVKVLVPTPQHVPTFPYVSSSFAWDEAGVLDPITRAGALTPDLYIPPGTFAVGYRDEAVPLMWKAGTADRWEEEDVHRLQRSMRAILFVGLDADAVVQMLDRSVPGGIAEGTNWTLWMAAPNAR